MGDKTNREKSESKPLSSIMETVLRRCQGGKGQNARLVWSFWDRVVGENLSRNAQPAAFKNTLLIVHVSSSVWLQELHFKKKELIEKLNQAAGSTVVEDIRFKLGALPEK